MRELILIINENRHHKHYHKSFHYLHRLNELQFSTVIVQTFYEENTLHSGHVTWRDIGVMTSLRFVTDGGVRSKDWALSPKVTLLCSQQLPLDTSLYQPTSHLWLPPFTRVWRSSPKKYLDLHKLNNNPFVFLQMLFQSYISVTLKVWSKSKWHLAISSWMISIFLWKISNLQTFKLSLCIFFSSVTTKTCLGHRFEIKFTS